MVSKMRDFGQCRKTENSPKLSKNIACTVAYEFLIVFIHNLVSRPSERGREPSAARLTRSRQDRAVFKTMRTAHKFAFHASQRRHTKAAKIRLLRRVCCRQRTLNMSGGTSQKRTCTPPGEDNGESHKLCELKLRGIAGRKKTPLILPTTSLRINTPA